MNILKSVIILFLITSLTANLLGQGSLTSVSSFGTNPGSLNMYTYVPAGISGSVSLVIALHGCSQSASIYAAQSGWNKLADRHKFIMVYPEQLTANNASKCFNWFDPVDQSKNQGEALSIKQMVDYMKSNYTIDNNKIFVTGLSAGAGMTSVMLATYPEIFNKGAIIAGLPYKAATSSIGATSAMGGYVVKTPAQWSAIVKNENPAYLGPFPHIAIFHGTFDLTVNINNANELIKQWTDVNNADQTADFTNSSFGGNTSVEQTIYNDNLNNPVVYYYKIIGMGHGISLDTGSCPRQGGVTGTYSLEKNFHSTYWAADFFDLITNPYSISGSIQVTQNANNVTYSILNTAGSTYAWTVPSGASIISGQGSNSIVVNFGTSSGTITVQEVTGAGCINDVASLHINVLYNVTVSQTAVITCHGSATAALSVVATGGNSPYSYSWSPSGGTGATASGLTAGVYFVTVTDNASGSVTSTSFTINQPALISGNQILTLCAGQTVTIGSHTHSTPNSYSDTLTAANGCDSVLTTILNFHPLTTVNLNLTGNDTLCNSGGVFVLNGGTPLNGIYSGSGVSSGSFNPVIANLGWNIVTYSFTDGNNCAGTAKDSLYVNTCISTGLPDNDILNSTLVYPNPASDAILVSVKKAIPFEVNLYNSMGALILVKKFSTSLAKIDIRNLNRGIYLIKIKSEYGIVTQRIVVD